MEDKVIKEKLVLKPIIKKSILKCLWSIVFVLIGMILSKNNDSMKEMIKKRVYETSFPVMDIRKIYQKYFSTIEYPTTQPVFHNINKSLKENDTIYAVESGIVIGLDNDKIILEQVDGVVATYSSIENSQLKIYDYLEKGEKIGEAKENSNISFSKEGEPYEYQKNI